MKMDEINLPVVVLLNLLLVVLLATFLLGFRVLIVFGLIMAPLMLVLLACMFFEAGTGIAPLSFLKRLFPFFK